MLCGGVVSARRDARHPRTPERNETRYERPPITFATILAAMARTGLLRHPPRRREIALPLCKRRKALSAACSWDSFSLGKPRGAVTGASLGTRCLDRFFKSHRPTEHDERAKYAQPAVRCTYTTWQTKVLSRLQATLPPSMRRRGSASART